MLETRGMKSRAGLVGTGRFMYVASVFIMNVGLARSMQTEEFGAFQQVFMFNAVFLIFALGIPDTVYYFLPRLSTAERRRFLGQTVAVLAAAGAAVGVLFWFGSSQIADMQNNPAIGDNIRVFGIYGGFLVASAFSDPIFIFYKRIRYLLLLSGLHAAMLVGITLWEVLLHPPQEHLFAALAVFGGVKYAVALYSLSAVGRETGGVRFFGGSGNVVLQLTFALPIALTAAVEIASRWLDKFVVSIYFGPEELGLFFIGAIEIPFIGVVVSSMYNVVSPLLNQYHHEGRNRDFGLMVSKTFKFTSKIVWPVFAYLAVFADHLIPIVFGDGYMGSVEPFRIYLLMLPLRIASYGAIVIAVGRPRVVFWSAFAALGINFVLNIALVTTVGFAGPAMATVISTYVHVGILLYIVCKELGIRLTTLVPFNFLNAVGVTVGLSVIIAYLLTWTIRDDLVTVAISLVVYTATYLFLGSRAKFFTLSSVVDVLTGEYGKKTDNRHDNRTG